MPIIFPPDTTSFTQVTVTGTFARAEGPAAGKITFTLTQAMANGDSILPPSPVTVTLDENGHFAIGLAANDDEATVPTGIRYGVTEEIEGAQPRDYFIVVSRAESPLDISTLMPGDPGWT